MTLKPCPNPKCRGNNLKNAFDFYWSHRVLCRLCGLWGPGHPDQLEAENLWNSLPRSEEDN